MCRSSSYDTPPTEASSQAPKVSSKSQSTSLNQFFGSDIISGSGLFAFRVLAARAERPERAGRAFGEESVNRAEHRSASRTGLALCTLCSIGAYCKRALIDACPKLLSRVWYARTVGESIHCQRSISSWLVGRQRDEVHSVACQIGLGLWGVLWLRHRPALRTSEKSTWLPRGAGSRASRFQGGAPI